MKFEVVNALWGEFKLKLHFVLVSLSHFNVRVDLYIHYLIYYGSHAAANN